MKIKQVFVKDRDVDLPEGAETAPTNTITLPENYDDLELFFEPDAAAGLGHGAVWFVCSASSTANSVDITLEDPDAFDDGFEEQYAYDDRIVGDDDDDFIDDEIDTELRPTPGFRTRVRRAHHPSRDGSSNEGRRSWRITTRRTSGAGSVPRRVDRTTTAASSTAMTGTMISRLCRWTTIWRMRTASAAPGAGFKTPARLDQGGEGKENAPNSTSTVGVAVEWGKTAQKANRPGPEPAKRAKRKNANVMKVKLDRETTC